MKKALVVFLILAVAGGLFAQISWSGSVETGLGIGFDNKDDSKPLVDYVRDRGDNGLRADLNASYTGGGDDDPYGKWGVGLGVRAQVNKFTDGESYALSANDGNVWWQPNSIFYLAIGAGANKDVYGTPGGLGFKQSIHDADGLKIQLIPMAGLSIGAHAFYGKTLKNLADMNIGLGVNYSMPSLLTIIANFRYKPDQTDNKFDVGAGANFLALSAVGLTKLAADVGTYNFGDDSKFFIGIGESITFKALENLLTLDLAGQQYIWMGKDSKDFIPMRYRFGLSYVIDKITPAIQVQYAMGSVPAWNYRAANDSLTGWGGTAQFDQKDLNALGVSPQITFNFGPTLVLGYNLQMDMSKDKPSTAAGKTMQHMIYGTVAISY
jgi:hypothetical protein